MTGLDIPVLCGRRSRGTATDTFDAEYVALTQLHADALIRLDRQLADAVKDLVTVAPLEALYRPSRPYQRHCHANMLFWLICL
jgi:hypothetical protein